MLLKCKGININNPTLGAVTRVLAILPLLCFSRLCLWIFNLSLFDNKDYFSIISGGLRFDLSALLVVNLPYLVLASLPFQFRERKYYRRLLNILFVLINVSALIPNFADVFYFRFSMKRTGWEIFSFMSDGGGNDFISLLPSYIRDYWQASILLIIGIFFILAIIFKIRSDRQKGRGIRRYITDGLLFLFVCGLSIIGIRGGLQLKPINILSASLYASGRNTPLVYSSTFSIIKTYKIASLAKVNYFRDESEMLLYFDALKNRHIVSERAIKKENVVIVLLESFSTEYIGALNHGKARSLTPFLDSLCGESLCYCGISNSKRSIEALPAVLSALPNLMISDYITSPYAGNQINSLASILKTEGYNTSFYHGGKNGTMGFDTYCKMAGFEYYFGRDEYPFKSDFDGTWGIWDHAFFQWYADQLNNIKEPFLSGIFSLSSHHPYLIPKGMENRFPPGDQKISATIAYADYALSLFFNKAKKMPWYKNTIFVITADHTSESNEPWYQTRAGVYSIPVIFYKPGARLTANKDLVVQQTDIMPSVLDYLGYSRPYVAFGNSVFKSGKFSFAVNYVSEEYMIFMNDRMMVMSDGIPSSVFDLKSDPFQQRNIKNLNDTLQQRMLLCGKSLIQQYNQRMISNELSVREK